MKFKVGDMARNVSPESRNLGKIGKIVRVEETNFFPYSIEYTENGLSSYGTGQDKHYELEKVNWKERCMK